MSQKTITLVKKSNESAKIYIVTDLVQTEVLSIGSVTPSPEYLQEEGTKLPNEIAPANIISENDLKEFCIGRKLVEFKDGKYVDFYKHRGDLKERKYNFKKIEEEKS